MNQNFDKDEVRKWLMRDLLRENRGPVYRYGRIPGENGEGGRMLLRSMTEAERLERMRRLEEEERTQEERPRRRVSNQRNTKRNRREETQKWREGGDREDLARRRQGKEGGKP